MDRHEEAVALAREVLDITRRLYPSDHPVLGGKLNALASALSSAGRDAEAEPFSREALAINRRALPADSVRLAASIYNHAMLLLDLGDPAQALPLLAEARNIAAKGYGENDFRTLLTATGQLYALHESGDAKGTQALAADLTARMTSSDAAASFPVHTYVTLLARLARIRLELGDASETLRLLERIETGNGAAHASAPGRTIVDALRLRAYIALGQRERADAQAGTLRARLRDAPASDDPDVADAFATLGPHALATGDTALAHSDLAAARAVFGERAIRTRSARQIQALEQALSTQDSRRLEPVTEDRPRR